MSGEDEVMTECRRVDLDSAPLELLQSLPRIGKSRASAIIDLRSGEGLSVSGLVKITGISFKEWEKLHRSGTIRSQALDLEFPGNRTLSRKLEAEEKKPDPPLTFYKARNDDLVARTERMEGRMDDITGRMDDMEARMDDMEARMAALPLQIARLMKEKNKWRQNDLQRTERPEVIITPAVAEPFKQESNTSLIKGSNVAQGIPSQNKMIRQDEDENFETHTLTIQRTRHTNEVSLVVPIAVEDINILAVIDTAAQMTVISTEVYKQLNLPEKEHQTIKISNAQQGAIMEGFIVQGIKTQIGKKTYFLRAVIAPITDQMLLGFDFLQSQNAIIDLGCNELILQDEVIEAKIMKHHDGSTSQISRIYLPKSITVPPNTKQHVNVRIHPPIT